MTLLGAGAVVFAAATIAMTAAWLVQRRLGEADVVDLVWTAGLGGAAIAHAALLREGLPARRWLVAALVAVWSGRLALHLLRRVREPGEDGRYRALRERWGSSAQRLLLLFFLAQGVTVALLSLHFAAAMLHPADALRIWDLLGAAVVLLAVTGEAIADRQLAAFRADPHNAGRVCKRGLWRYSRHPNYFFEWLHWLAYPVIAWGAPWWPGLLVAPAAMYVLMRHVTGIPPTEAQALRSRGEAYRRYQRETSAFFPRPPSVRAPG